MPYRPGRILLLIFSTSALALAVETESTDRNKKPQRDQTKDQQTTTEKKSTTSSQDYKKLKLAADGTPLPTDHSQSEAAKAALDDARTALNQALSGGGAMPSGRVDLELAKVPEYKQASLELRLAQGDYDRVRQPIFDALRADSYYHDLEIKTRESEKLMRNLVLTGRGSFDYLFSPAMVALDYRKKMTREQIMAFAQAPEVQAAREKMLLAAAKVRAMRTSLINPQSYKAAQADIDKARDNFKSAMKSYNQALSDEAEYEKLRQEYIANQRMNPQVPPAEKKQK